MRLFEAGLIYRGKRLVNWDPVLQHRGVGPRGRVARGERHPLAAQVSARGRHRAPRGRHHAPRDHARRRTAVAVHPDDERYAHLVGKQVRLPLTDRLIPIIADDYVDREFGTGCVKITPAHDFNDYQVGERHGLPLISIFTLDAKINENAPARLPRAGPLRRAQEGARGPGGRGPGRRQEAAQAHACRARSARTWWSSRCSPTSGSCAMDGMAKAGLAAVGASRAQRRFKFAPENWTTTYDQWLENIQDWCISRQLWWGHQIPAWYAEDGNVFVGRTSRKHRARHRRRQDDRGTSSATTDVLDTWFSSGLVPFSSLGWPDEDVPSASGSSTCRPRCWSPASTSSSSGSRA